MSEFLDHALLLSVPLFPLLLLLSLVLPLARKLTLRLIPTAPIPALFAALLLSSEPEFSLPWLLLGSSIGIDTMSRVFLLFSSLLWLSGSLSLPATGRLRFCGWFLATMTGNFMVLLAQDMPTFFLAYAVMSLASFGMIVHWRTQAATHAARIYLVFAMLGEMILLTAMLLVADSALTLDLDYVRDRVPQHLLMALLFIGFGIKAGVPLLHMALPPAYAAVPLAAAVPMAGALFHLGLYGWLRFLPLGAVNVPLWSTIFFGAGVFAVLYGVCVGLTQREARSLLAYSSISQMGIMMLGIGAGLAYPDNWSVIEAALLFYTLHHALTKGALFHGLGAHGSQRVGIWLPALVIAGIPFSSGALAKASLKEQLLLLPDFWIALIPWLLPLSSIGTTLLMARFLFLRFKAPMQLEQTSTSMWWLLLAVIIFLPWLSPLSIDWKDAFWSLTWPLLVGVMLAWSVYQTRLALAFRLVPSTPPGDIVVALERLIRPLLPQPAGHTEHEKEVDALLHPPATPALVALPERLLGKWTVAVVLLLLVLVSLLLLLRAEF